MGAGIAAAGVGREKLWVTGKVSAFNVGSAEQVLQHCRASLNRLGCGYFDLYLIHAPFDLAAPLPAAWAALEATVDAGLCRNIGVSNFRWPDLEEVLGGRIRPLVNQLECHPHLQQASLLAAHRDAGVAVSAYSPLLPLNLPPGEEHGPLAKVLRSIAHRHSRSPSQVLLRWCLERGCAPITTSRRPARMGEMLSLDFELGPDEVAAIAAAGEAKHVRRYWAAHFV